MSNINSAISGFGSLISGICGAISSVYQRKAEAAQQKAQLFAAECQMRVEDVKIETARDVSDESIKNAGQVEESKLEATVTQATLDCINDSNTKDTRENYYPLNVPV